MNPRYVQALYEGKRRAPVRVGDLDYALCREIGATRAAVWLSYETMSKQLVRHPELGSDHYLVAPLALTYGAVFRDVGQSLMILYEDTCVFGVTFKLALKATKAGDEIFLTSLHQMRWRHIAGQCRRKELLRRHWMG